jgi:hypothetical protein
VKPPGEVLRAKDYVVQDVSLATCRELVSAHHYARGGSNTTTHSHGLFHRDDPFQCLGVTWWLPPTKGAAQATWHEWTEVLSLSRLVILPEVPANGASFLLGQSIRRISRIDPRWKCLVTYADEWQGHTGAIYRATNWEYLGLTAPSTVWIDPLADRMVARKAGGHTRTVDEMLALGYIRKTNSRKHKFRKVI